MRIDSVSNHSATVNQSGMQAKPTKPQEPQQPQGPMAPAGGNIEHRQPPAKPSEPAKPSGRIVDTYA